MKKWNASKIALKFLGFATPVCILLLVAAFTRVGMVRLAGKAWTRGSLKQAANPEPKRETPRWAQAHRTLPLNFEENQGQTAPEVRYVARGGRYQLFLASQEAVIALRPSTHLDFSPIHRSAYLQALRQRRRAAPFTAIRMHFEGANPAPRITGVERSPTRVNYFSGSDPKNWHTDVPAYARVKYTEIYPGVDLVFYGNQGRLEYDFMVAPGADPQAIQLKIDGARRIRTDAQGDLVLSVPGGEVEFQKPFVYQQLKCEKHEIPGSYLVEDNHLVTFSVGDYDRRLPLILDPVLNYSTYLGGSGIDGAFGIALDGSGDAFVAGQTFSIDFPGGTNAGLSANPNPNNGASFVAELNPAGTQLLYTSYLVGTTTNAGDGATAVAVDSTGKVYVTGGTFAAGFPSMNPLPFSADTTNGTCFVTKLDPTQSGKGALLFSTYLGGTGGDFCNGIAVDTNGNAYVGGETRSTDFPVVNAYQTTFNPANVSNASGSAFLSKINTVNFTLVYSTYLSGNAANAANVNGLGVGDVAQAVAVDAAENAYVVGATTSNNSINFPSSPNANETAPPAANVLGSAFVSKINTAQSGASSLAYSTYLAGSVEELGLGIALGPNNVAYVTGTTNSNDFPTTTGALDTSGAGAKGKAFVSVVDTTKTGVGNSLTYSTFLGGGNGDIGFGIRADGSANAYVVGTALSNNFPGITTLGGFQTTLRNPAGSAFIAKLFPGSKKTADLLYSTYFGGTGDGKNPDDGFAIAIDSANPPNAYITGQTSSKDLPTLTPLPGGGVLNGTADAYVAKLTLVPTLVVSPTSLSFGNVPTGTTSAAQTVTLTNNSGAGIAFNSATIINGNPAAATMDYVVSADTCGANIPSGASPANQCTVSVTLKPSVTAAETATLQLMDGDSTSPQLIALSGTGTPAPAVGLAPTPLAFGGQLVTTTSAAKTVTLTNTGNGNLTINTIGVSGDFAQTNTCGTLPAMLAPNANCTINVTFAPTAVGARAGTLTVTDNASGSPHTVPLTGTGWDFTVTAPASLTVKAGSPGSFNATITPLGGFNQAVTVACGGVVAPTTCMATSPVTPADGVTPVNSAISITTKGMIPLPPTMRTPPISMRQVVPLMLALCLLFGLFTARRLRTRIGMVTAILILVTLAGCGGSGAQKGTFSLTITASSGSVAKTANVTLTIN